jgi:hypothetical protein
MPVMGKIRKHFLDAGEIVGSEGIFRTSQRKTINPEFKEKRRWSEVGSDRLTGNRIKNLFRASMESCVDHFSA